MQENGQELGFDFKGTRKSYENGILYKNVLDEAISRTAGYRDNKIIPLKAPNEVRTKLKLHKSKIKHTF